MTDSTYSLTYDGERFELSHDDYKRLDKIYRSGLSVSGVLFRFTPVGGDGEVAISVGSGARFILTENPAPTV